MRYVANQECKIIELDLAMLDDIGQSLIHNVEKPLSTSSMSKPRPSLGFNTRQGFFALV